MASITCSISLYSAKTQAAMVPAGSDDAGRPDSACGDVEDDEDLEPLKSAVTTIKTSQESTALA
jgi:hypothetical protein